MGSWTLKVAKAWLKCGGRACFGSRFFRTAFRLEFSYVPPFSLHLGDSPWRIWQQAIERYREIAEILDSPGWLEALFPQDSPPYWRILFNWVEITTLKNHENLALWCHEMLSRRHSLNSGCGCNWNLCEYPTAHFRPWKSNRSRDWSFTRESKRFHPFIFVI